MSPVTHFLVGWAVATSAGLDRRERICVTLAGVVPDLDGLGIVAELLTRNSDHPLTWWSDYHHVLGHNLTLCMLTCVVACLLVKDRFKTGVLVGLSFHLHLLGDIVGARGPDGDQWPIPYFWPFNRTIEFTWDHQLALNAWPNMLITALLIIWALKTAWSLGISPLEMISTKANGVLVATLRKRFPPSTG